MRTLLCLLLCGICYAAGCKEKPFFKDAGPLVATDSGKVVGKYAKVFDTDVAAFLGIPFAKPPLGENRFRKPEPVEPWKGLLLAHDKPPPCMQPIHNVSWAPSTQASEDCLYLNIWTPTKCCCGSKDKMPVMVWIHGGGFTLGSTDMEVYDGSVLASYGEVIIISMNYRLGMFGFLNAGTGSAPGNAGLFDQALALRWIKDNIHHFGGDSDQITLFGESAGSMSISMHLTSPLSRGLFHRVIMQSGSMYNPPMLDTSEVAHHKAAEFAKLAGCGNDDAEEVVSCFKGMEARALVNLEDTLTRNSLVYFLPSPGNEFLPKSPIEAYEAGDFAKVDVLLGNVNDEGTLFLPILMPDVFRFDQQTKLTIPQAQDVSRGLLHGVPKPIADKIMDYYFQNATEGTPELVKAVADILGDFFFNCPNMFLAEKLDNAYMYWMTHQSQRAFGWMGVHHFADVAYVFGAPIVDSENFTPEDGRFSGDLIQKWVTFARQGYPLSDEDGSHSWRKFSKEDPVAWELNPRTAKLITFPRYEACNEVWRPIIVPQQPLQQLLI